ncbi:TonB-dependent receptor [Mucilaginibacter sp. UR6-11]|uniref:TonB-dependent receptor n=1 Tax=Mucilaginibacter sp. UR6-11 TaxID=1435644 RepID=UPI001E2ED063|nr:TonB-dependent receptor [Mucilaginibacter sp. UR6-11]MCC8423625.1 TonB-dependent receptor [Mucilaginibacter sp. UR6-11]
MKSSVQFFNVFLFMALICAVFSSKAQNAAGFNISGKVFKSLNTPADYATISLFKARDSSLIKGTLTNDQGVYVFDHIQPGTYYVIATAMGYKKTVSDTVMLVLHDLRILPLSLIEGTKQLKEVQITANRPLIENKLDKTVLNVANSPLAAGNNVLEILQKAPGVSVDNDQISLRGKAGVSILIDGKQTYLSADQLAALLRSTQASTIQTIEIITNPSSKYDAAGSSGIINIKLKKDQNYGTNGSLNFTQGYGIYHKTYAGMAINHREKYYNLFAGYNYGNWANFRKLDFDRNVTTGAATTYFNAATYNLQQYQSHNLRAGMDFYLNKTNTLGFIASGNIFKGKNEQNSTNYIGSVPSGRDSAVVGFNRGRSPYDYQAYNINYKSVLDTSGTELNVSFDYSRFNSTETYDYNNRFTDGDLTNTRSPQIYQTQAPNHINIYVGKIDFNHAFNKNINLEAGLKSALVKTANRLIFDTLLQNNYVNDPRRSDNFRYTESVSAAYVNLNSTFDKLSVQIGLRAENTYSKGESPAATIKRNYLNLFPTVFLMEQLSPDHTIGFSYSRRIDRPNYGLLNPFIYFIDQYTYRQGNPYLKPQYTDSYEVNYLFKNRYTLSIGYRHTGDAITTVILNDPLTKAIFQKSENLASNNYYNINLNAPIDIANWWTTNNNIVFFYNRFKSPDINGASLNLSKLAYQASSNQTFTFSQMTSVELNANYFSPAVQGIFNTGRYYGVDLGLNQFFFEKQFSIKLAVNDLFNTRGRQSSNSYQQGNNLKIRSAFDSRVGRLTLTYRFGNNKIKSSNKKTGSETEENRINKN